VTGGVERRPFDCKEAAHCQPVASMMAVMVMHSTGCAAQFVNLLSTAGLIIKPTMAVYARSKHPMRAIAEGWAFAR
jgi:short-subunit dehydrogenase